MQEITTIEELQSLKGLVAVDYYASWCGPCRILTPRFEQVAEANEDVTFVKCNTDDAPDLASSEGISALPTLKYYKDGVEVKKTTGLVTEEELQETVNSLKG
jgi:thioredoxin 1